MRLTTSVHRQTHVDAIEETFAAKGFDPVTALKQACAAIKSVVQRDAFIMAFNASLVIAIGLLVSAIGIWVVKVAKLISTPVPAH